MSVRNVAFSNSYNGNYRNCSFSADKTPIKILPDVAEAINKENQATEKEHRTNANKLIYNYIAIALVISGAWILFKVKGSQILEKMGFLKK